MAATSKSGARIAGTVRTTWVRDELAHVLEHADTDETSGTWTGLACPDHRLRIGSDVSATTLRALGANGAAFDLVWEAPSDIVGEHARAFLAAMEAYEHGNMTAADMHWRDLQAICSQAWAANYAVLELLQQAGITKFAPVKPQRWVVASFEHHSGPHGIQRPHIHNVVLGAFTTGPDLRKARGKRARTEFL